MAEDSDLEKTESASSRRLEQAREEGQVPQSRELATFISLMVGVVGLYVLGRWSGHRMMEIVRSGLNFERRLAFEPGGMGQVMSSLATDALFTVAPLLAASVIAALATPFLMGGWVFSTNVLRFDLSRLDPMQGLGRMFSTHGLVELVKASLKAVLVASVGVWVVWRERDHLFALMLQPLETSMDDFAALVLLSALLIVSSLALIAAIEKLEDKAEIDSLYELIKKHADLTKSQKAFKVLALWEQMLPKFVKVMPKDYKRVLQAIKKAKDDGLTGDDALNAAFEANARDVARIGGS